MDIQAGDKITYRYINTKDKKELTRIVIDETEIKDYKNMLEDKEREFAIEILKIERPSYELVEKKKELLTDEEREFLKLYIKFCRLYINRIKKTKIILDSIWKKSTVIARCQIFTMMKKMNVLKT